MANLIDLIVSRVVDRLVAEMATDGPEYDAVYDLAHDEARARGMDEDAAYREAARVADEWKAAHLAAQEDQQ
jgi:hypothetical protein